MKYYLSFKDSKTFFKFVTSSLQIRFFTPYFFHQIHRKKWDNLIGRFCHVAKLQPTGSQIKRNTGSVLRPKICRFTGLNSRAERTVSRQKFVANLFVLIYMLNSKVFLKLSWTKFALLKMFYVLIICACYWF